jgi:hypothetical protein
MPCYRLDDRLWFPPLDAAEDCGLLAVGGDLAPERLLFAYSSGIFPWYNEGRTRYTSPVPCVKPCAALFTGSALTGPSMR